ncbi:LysM peptidoglycan-binding domain-containing protein, partial [Vineibacter terrae]|uniref:LysM peptidoglycan-binding domain-containing protein n=1 Tax=Vineibacter terrae TaxID=2586908 RepID=UPI002E3530BB
AAAGSPAPQIAGAPPPAAAPAPADATRSADTARPAPPAALPTTSTPAPAPPMAPGTIAPTFDIARIAPDGRGVIAGRAQPGARVTVLDGERVLAAVDADARGEWVVVIDPPLAPGAHDLRLVEHRDGREIARSDRTITVDVPVRSGALTAPAVAGTSPQAGAAPSASLPLVVSTPAAGGPSTVIQAPGGPDALARSGKLVLGAVDYDEQGQLTVTGQAPAGTTVRVYVDNRVAGDATAGVDGRWTLQPADAIALGKRTVRIDQLGAGGGVTSRLEVPFERMTLARPGVVTIVRGDNLWNIARARYGDGQRYTVIYEANKNQIRDPNLIYPGQTFVIPKSLD